MFYKILGGFFIFGALALVGYANRDFFIQDAWNTASPSQRISLMVEADIKNLASKNELPPEWDSISKVDYKFESPLAKTLMANQRPNIQITKKKSAERSAEKPSQKDESKKNPEANLKDQKDQYELEIAVLDIPDEEAPGFIFQMSLFDIQTKNKIYELGRTYHWSTLNNKILDEKKPD